MYLLFLQLDQTLLYNCTGAGKGLGINNCHGSLWWGARYIVGPRVLAKAHFEFVASGGAFRYGTHLGFVVLASVVQNRNDNARCVPHPSTLPIQ